MTDRPELTSRQLRALEAGSVIPLPPSIDLKGSRTVPLGGYPIDRVDEGSDDPVYTLLLRFGAEAAVLLFDHALHVLRVLDGEPAVHAAIATDLGDGLFALPVPPEPHAAVHLLYIESEDRILLLGGYPASDPVSTRGTAISDATARRPDMLRW
jgi:hypothetical protein